MLSIDKFGFTADLCDKVKIDAATESSVEYFKLNLLPYYIFAVKVAAQGIKDFFKNFKYYWSPNN